MKEITLKQWMEETGKTVAEIATGCRISDKAVYKYLRGERIPRRPAAERIRDFTGGRVTPNSFYLVEAQP